MVAFDNPVVSELWRDGALESQHRGAWVAVDLAGTVLDSRGDPDQPVFPRSATKSMQGLPFIESGAADALGAEPAEVALAVSSHSGEPMHQAIAAGLLDRVGLDAGALRCGPQRPIHPDHAGEPALRISNNCSGKHSAFLATAHHLGDPPATYLEPGSRTQRAVRDAVAAMTDTAADDLGHAIDGCSAPTFRMPLRALALGLGRVANPDGLEPNRAAACRRITEAARLHPTLIGGTRDRLDTDLLAASDGRIFAKAGAEAVFAVGVVGAGVGFACKIDDGNQRGYSHLVIDVLHRLGHLSTAEVGSLAHWTDPVRRNWDRLDVGRHVIPDPVRP